MLPKKYSDFDGSKKNNLIQFQLYNLMLNSGKKIRAKKKKNSERKKTIPPRPAS